MKKLLIVIRSGMISAVFSNGQEMDVTILDMDNLAIGENPVNGIVMVKSTTKDIKERIKKVEHTWKDRYITENES